MKAPLVSVIMPTFNQATFLPRSLESLLSQTLRDWELVIVNDGSSDRTESIVNSLEDERIVYLKNEANEGLGNAINKGLELARGTYIAYLPSDDVFYADHLKTLVHKMSSVRTCILCYSGVRHNYNRFSYGRVHNLPLQLVQVMHKKVREKWVEREELTTDDLDLMYWSKLNVKGDFLETGQITCEWVSHPDQRHRKIREPEGGINLYRTYYEVKRPLRFKSSVGNYIDEDLRFKKFQKTRGKKRGGLTILLAGELAYNPERILALEERGHNLAGLWIKNPYWYNTVGPLPFGNIESLNASNWKEEIKRLKPDIIYGLLNWQAVPFVHKILQEVSDIPLVWNFKEGPFICLEKGTWKELIELYTFSDGQIFTTPEMKEWFKSFLPSFVEDRTLLLDGDLPKKDWFDCKSSPLLSSSTGEIHTVVPGRPIGLHSEVVGELARRKIHLHFYGDFTQGQWKEWIESTSKVAGRFLHTHPNVDQENWVKEFSRYDAGWLHSFESRNFGEIRRANWDDLNYPARIATLALGGVPLLQKNNEGHIVATQNLTRQFDIGIHFNDMDDLCHQLNDVHRMKILRDNTWKVRDQFTFDFHVDRLEKFFYKIIQTPKSIIRRR